MQVVSFTKYAGECIKMRVFSLSLYTKRHAALFAQIVLTLNVLDGCVQFRLSRFRRCFTGSFGIVYNFAS